MLHSAITTKASLEGALLNLLLLEVAVVVHGNEDNQLDTPSTIVAVGNSCRRQMMWNFER